MPKARASERAAYMKILALIRRDSLAGRVTFTDSVIPARRQAVIAQTPSDIRAGHIFGHTPEAVASAILRAARANS